MGKSVYIAEKPSVAQEFAKALHLNLKRKDGYLELSLIHISEPTRPILVSRMPSSA